MKLPAPLGIISLPWVWLSKWTESVCVAYVATTAVFIVDSVVHFVVGLPWTFLLNLSFAWNNFMKDCPFLLKTILLLFSLISAVLVFLMVTWKSFEEFKNYLEKAQTAVRSATKTKYGKGSKVYLHSDRTDQLTVH